MELRGKWRLLEGRDGVEEEVDPSYLSRRWLARIVGGEPVRDCASSVVRFDRRRQQWKCHQFWSALHLRRLRFGSTSFFLPSSVLYMYYAPKRQGVWEWPKRIKSSTKYYSLYSFSISVFSFIIIFLYINKISIRKWGGFWWVRWITRMVPSFAYVLPRV